MLSTIALLTTLGLILGFGLGIAVRYLKLETDSSHVLGIFMPMIITFCGVLGLTLHRLPAPYHVMQSLFLGFGAALGFIAVLFLFKNHAERFAFIAAPGLFLEKALSSNRKRLWNI